MPHRYPYRHARNRVTRPIGFNPTPDKIHMVAAEILNATTARVTWSGPIAINIPAQVNALDFCNYAYPDVYLVPETATHLGNNQWELTTSAEFNGDYFIVATAIVINPLNDAVLKFPDMFKVASL